MQSRGLNQVRFKPWPGQQDLLIQAGRSDRVKVLPTSKRTFLYVLASLCFGSGIMRFARRSRLLQPDEFKRVFKQALRSGDESFRMLARPNELHHHRLGMAVSKKACSKAVGRNRIKRLVRESFRTQIAGQTTDVALDFVVLPTARAVDQSNKDLGSSLQKHWQKLINSAAQPGRTNQGLSDNG